MPNENSNKVSLRPAEPNDEQFLLRLYTAGRTSELQAVSWSQDEIEEFCEMQFRAQNFNYALTYTDAVDQIIEADGQSIGRLKVLENENEILLVDIALLPQNQNRGIGTMFLEQLKSRARDVKKPLRLHVLMASPAVLLYERLGFTRVADDGVYIAMELLPETTAITK